MSAEELIELLKEDTSGRDKPQSGVVTDKVRQPGSGVAEWRGSSLEQYHAFGFIRCGCKRTHRCGCKRTPRPISLGSCMSLGCAMGSLKGSCQTDVTLMVFFLQVLDQLLDRRHLLLGKPAPYQSSGIGYEVVQVVESSGILARVE